MRKYKSVSAWFIFILACMFFLAFVAMGQRHERLEVANAQQAAQIELMRVDIQNLQNETERLANEPGCWDIQIPKP